jgi:mono/diheme cytochrome c family protein
MTATAIHRAICAPVLLALVAANPPRLAAADAPADLPVADQEYLDWGKELFLKHCAACHGRDALGDGPAAASLKTRPADLTRIRQRHDGTFPRFDVVRYIEGNRPVAAHGSSEMPVWGRIFRARPSGSAGASPEIYALTDYLQSIQQP